MPISYISPDNTKVRRMVESSAYKLYQQAQQTNARFTTFCQWLVDEHIVLSNVEGWQPCRET